jgi:type VI secretion system secreted protein Hcp
MPADYFLDIDGIKGEATDEKHKDKIQLLSWSWGETQTGASAAAAGGGAGKVSMQDFHFVMNINKASPDLMLNCALGSHIAKAQLTCRKAGGKQQEYFKIFFTNLLISSYQTGGSSQGSDLPVDQISFNYATIKFEYAAQKPDGSLDTPVIRGYDLKQQKKI